MKFLVIGNMNAITYKEIWPLIQADRMWVGTTGLNRDMVFAVPAGKVVADSDRAKAERLGYVGDFTCLRNTCWFTNLDHYRRHEPLSLLSTEHNLRFTKVMAGKSGYDRYDNYDAIEVPQTKAIPSDHPGVMGVPISFLDKYCPEQFEIVGALSAGALGEQAGATYTEIETQGKTIMWNGAVVNRKGLYKRILIRHRSI
jgi:hypothetical protein